MKILQITPFFSPNIGGVETHLDDLVKELAVNKISSNVLTYQPVMSKEKALSEERVGNYIYIRRLEIFRNLFIKVEPYPILDFLLLTPTLLIYSFYFLFKNHSKIDIIHSHGLNAALIGCILKFFFRKPLIISTHVTYALEKTFLSKLVFKIFDYSDYILTLSFASKNELIKLGINKNKIEVYRYWVNQDLFKLRDRQVLRKKYGYQNNDFIVLFVGRLIEKKGLIPLIEGFNLFNDTEIKLLIAGTGPLEDYVKESSEKNKNIIFLGGLKSELLKDYYSISNTLIIPSTHDEGFGRVILEALSCGIPIIASNRGGIPEAVDENVSILFKVNPKNVFENILLMRKMVEKKGIDQMSKICRKFAEKNYSCDNINTFIKIYEKIIR
jgi:glycosyltransferase involved in cell wall biosynthesis